jgi:hypothetical protein
LITIWTGDIGRALPNGEIYLFAEVLAMAKAVCRLVERTREVAEA